jgi:serpin B
MRRTLLALLVLPLLAVACSDDGGGSAEGGSGEVSIDAVPVADRSRPSPDDDPTVAGAPTLDLGVRLLGELDGDGNTIISPASIAIALAMVEPGATGDAQPQLRELLGIVDPAQYHAAMNALEQSLETREAADHEEGELTARISNGAYLQQGYPFEQAYLDTIGRYYGPVLNEVDVAADADAVAEQINADVAEATNDRITELIPPGTLSPDTVLALVNALYLNASWQEPFDAEATEDGTFTTPDGEVTVPLMHGASSTSAAGDGWVAATKRYVGGLEAQFVLPDEDRFDDVEVTEAFDTLAQGGIGAELVVPNFESRYQSSLTDALQALGLTAPYQNGNLLGIADDDRLVVSDVIHETWLEMDEEGTEAAAATAVLAVATGLPQGEPVPVVLDRPFWFRIWDPQTATTLFLGRVTDPS